MVKAFAIVWGILSLLSTSWAAGQTAATDPKAEGSYSLGYEFGESLRKQQLEVDPEVLLGAVRAGLEGSPPAVGVDKMREILEQLRRNVTMLQQRRIGESAARNLEAGKAFLEANRAKEGVKALASGLQYKVLREGTGPSPTPTDRVVVNYIGTLIDGTEFDNSYRRGQAAAFSVNRVIKGWTEALQLMKVGSKWELYLPPDLAYGARGMPPNIGPKQTLVFEVELLSIEPK